MASLALKFCYSYVYLVTGLRVVQLYNLDNNNVSDDANDDINSNNIFTSAVHVYDFHVITVIDSPLHGFIWNQNSNELSVGLLTQSVKHCTGIAEVMGSNPVQTWIFFRPYFHHYVSGDHGYEYRLHIQHFHNNKLNKYDQHDCSGYFYIVTPYLSKRNCSSFELLVHLDHWTAFRTNTLW